MSNPCGIYCIVCLPNRRIYVGQSINLFKRLKTHKYRLSKGKHTNLALQKAWNKYGKEFFIFHVLEYCSEKVVLNREKQWMKLLKSLNQSIGFNKNG